MFTPLMCHEMRDCINEIRRETRTRVIVLTGAGEKFFCIGGRKEGMEDTTLYAGTLPTLEMYEAIEKLQKPVIASVNGFAVGGGNVLQMMCDCTIAKESAVFRQVGPMMGTFDAGYGTWYLEDLVGKKKAKEMWFRNPKISAREALAMGLINKVVPDDELKAATREIALEIAERGAFALASVKAAFNARHGGVSGLSRMAHDLLLRAYLDDRREQGALQGVRRQAQARRVQVRQVGSAGSLCARSSRFTIRRRRGAITSRACGGRTRSTGCSRGMRRRRPDAIALQDGRRKLTWRALQGWVDGVAADLRAKGLAGGDRVSIWMSNRAEAVVMFLACAREGLACNPSLHRTFTCAEIGQLLERFSARALLTEPG